MCIRDRNTWYTVISPESCSSILWRSWDKKETAAEQLKLTSDHMLKFGLVDGVVPEPLGGAHWDYDEAGRLLKEYLKPVSYTHLRAHETPEHLVCRLLL